MPDHKYTNVGWFLVCKRKVNGTWASGPGKCSESENHSVGLPHNAKFCQVCGALVEHEQEPRYMSFVDILNDEAEEVGLNQQACSELTDDFYRVPFDLIEENDFTEILIPAFDGLFHIPESEEDEDSWIDIDPNEVRVDFDHQRELLKERTKRLEAIYDKIEVHFGRVDYWA